MIGDFLVRLLVALPVVLLLAVGTLLLWRRMGMRLPVVALPALPRTVAWMAPAVAGGQLQLVCAQALLPGVRVAVLRYAGQAYLVGAGPQGVTLLAMPGAALPLPAAPPAPLEEVAS
jgi:hypothetical protein